MGLLNRLISQPVIRFKPITTGKMYVYPAPAADGTWGGYSRGNTNAADDTPLTDSVTLPTDYTKYDHIQVRLQGSDYVIPRELTVDEDMIEDRDMGEDALRAYGFRLRWNHATRTITTGATDIVAVWLEGYHG